MKKILSAISLIVVLSSFVIDSPKVESDIALSSSITFEHYWYDGVLIPNVYVLIEDKGTTSENRLYFNCPDGYYYSCEINAAIFVSAEDLYCPCLKEYFRMN